MNMLRTEDMSTVGLLDRIESLEVAISDLLRAEINVEATTAEWKKAYGDALKQMMDLVPNWKDGR